MLWQLSTSVAHGASGVSWFIIELSNILVDTRNVPINQLGDRTEQYGWLREVNCVFNNYCGEIINTLTIDECYHVGEAYGGVPLFKPFDSIRDISSSKGTPLIVSSFHNDVGEKFYIVCNNSPEKSTCVSVEIPENITLLGSVYGNQLEELITIDDPVGKKMRKQNQIAFFLAPGQLIVLKELLKE